jgi:hypothetical protein
VTTRTIKTVEPADPAEDIANDVLSVLERIHIAQALRGHLPRSVEEIEAYLADMRDDDERCRMIEQIQEEGRRQREGQQTPDCPNTKGSRRSPDL